MQSGAAKNATDVRPDCSRSRTSWSRPVRSSSEKAAAASACCRSREWASSPMDGGAERRRRVTPAGAWRPGSGLGGLALAPAPAPAPAETLAPTPAQAPAQAAETLHRSGSLSRRSKPSKMRSI